MFIVKYTDKYNHSFIIIIFFFQEIYKRELWASSRIGRHTIENELVSASIRELGDTVDQINRQQNQVFAEKDKLQVCFYNISLKIVYNTLE